MTSSEQNRSADPIFAGPGDIRSRCRAIDWSATPLGPVAGWPLALRLAVRMCLDARFPMAVWAGPELVLIYNDGYPPVLGPEKHPAALGRRAREVWSELWDRLAPELAQVMEGRESTHHEDAPFLLRRGGREEESFFTYSFTPIQDEDGPVVGALNVFVETTEKVRSLRERTDLLRAISASSQDAIFAKDLHGRVLFANPAGCAVTGRAVEQVLGKTDLELMDDQDAARMIMENDRRVMESGTPVQIEERVALADGRIHVWDSLKRPYRDAGGRIIGLFGISRDITERKRQEDAFRAAQEAAELDRRRLLAVLEALPAGIAIADAHGRLVQTNAALDRIWGSPPRFAHVDDFVQRRAHWLSTGEPVQASDWPLARTLSLGEVVRGDRIEIEKFDGSGTATITSIAAPIRDGAGRLLGGVVVVIDTTEQRQAEEAMRASEEKLRTVIENSRDGINLLDLKTGRYTFMSPAQIKLTGFTAEEMNALSAEEALARVHPDDRAASLHQQQEIAAGRDVPGRIEYRWRVKSGEYRWFSDSRKLVRDGQGRPVALVGVSRDITDRKQAEARAREHEERYRALFEAIDEGLCIVEVRFAGPKPLDCRFLEVNPAFEHTGIKYAVGGLLSDLAPEHLERWCQAFGGVAQTGTSTRFQGPALTRGRTYDIYAFRVGAAEQRRVAVLFNDITESKRTEVALREADRRKNEFLAMLSHELRNPLAPIKNSLYVLDRAVPGSDPARRAQAVIGRQVDQIARLVNDLLDVTRIANDKVQLQRRRLELNELVLRTVEDHQASFDQAGVRLAVAPAAVPVFVAADRNRVAQMVGNLLQNAVKFTPPQGQVTVSVSTDDATEQAVVRVADTGLGMTPELIRRLFEPFTQGERTLDRSRGGLGLGLALVKALVELHGGEVTATSAGVGRGSELTIRLPLDRGEPATAERERTPAGSAHRRVLIIEDNNDAAESLREILELDGHEVAVSSNGQDGLDRARAFRPDLVLCDIGLPGMDGYAVARAFRASEPLRNMPLVALSGYALPEDLQRAAEAGFTGHLAKPPSIEQLERLLAELPEPAPQSAP